MNISWIDLNEADRRTILEQTSVRTGYIVQAVEKDWWVTTVLEALFSLPFANIHVLAVYAFTQAHYISGTTFVPHSEPLHFIPLSFHAYTSTPHSFGCFLPFHSAGSIHTVSHYPSHFPTHFQRYVFIFSDESPMR
jgi:hypothetical protein